MANYLCIFAAPDAHIDFLRDHPDLLWAYIDGERPKNTTTTPKQTIWQRFIGTRPATKSSTVVPEDWPENEPILIGPEVNHRNVDLYHLILNGTTDFVDGSGSLFQTWLTNGNHSAIDLTEDNEHFAFKAEQIPALVKLLRKVDASAVKSRFTQWLQAQGEKYDPADEECEEIAKEFQAFAEAAQEAVNKSQGLIWISS